MTIKEYKEILDTTENNVSYYDYKQKQTFTSLKRAMDIAYSMKYETALKTIKNILDNYGKVTRARVDENNYLTYIVLKTPEHVREQIQNLKYHVENKQVSDVSENIISIR